MNIRIEKYCDGYSIIIDGTIIHSWNHDDEHGAGLADAIQHILEEFLYDTNGKFTITEEEVY